MDKSPEAFRTISEVADGMGLPQHVLRFWETRFPQIKPLKRGGGRRYYRPDDVELLNAIKRMLYDEGYTIRGVQKMLREHGAKALAAQTPSGAGANLADAPGEGARAPHEPRLWPEPAPTPEAPPPRPSHAADFAPDFVRLRAALADLREAERLLTPARRA